MSRWSAPPEPVDPSEIRAAFNAGRYDERAAGGEFDVTIVWDRAANPQQTNEPPGTRSQILLYESGLNAVALVHQYLRPDGSLGGSGRPDPKVLALPDGRVIRARA
jgi:hypothetical protein